LFYSDPYRLSVVLNNLISNSIKYRDVRKKNQYIKIQAHISPAITRIEFSDNGIGISKELLNKIYDMFFRATEKSEGAGLGLYIVKEAIEKLGGRISAISNLGLGTHFIIELPNRFDPSNPDNTN
jgi:signal transduction histidine kinase